MITVKEAQELQNKILDDIKVSDRVMRRVERSIKRAASKGKR